MKYLIALSIALTSITAQAISSTENDPEKFNKIVNAMQLKVQDLNKQAEKALARDDLDTFNNYKCKVLDNLEYIIKYTNANLHIDGAESRRDFFEDRLRYESLPLTMSNIKKEDMCKTTKKPQ